MLEGTLESYGEGALEAQTANPGDRIDAGYNTTRTYRIPESAWMLEYGQGDLPTTLYAQALAPSGWLSLVVYEAGGLTSSIVGELIGTLVNDAFGLGTGLAGLF